MRSLYCEGEVESAGESNFVNFPFCHLSKRFCTAPEASVYPPLAKHKAVVGHEIPDMKLSCARDEDKAEVVMSFHFVRYFKANRFCPVEYP